MDSGNSSVSVEHLVSVQDSMKGVVHGCCWLLSAFCGWNVVVLSAAASMVVIYLYRASTDSYIVNLNHYWCCFG